MDRKDDGAEERQYFGGDNASIIRTIIKGFTFPLFSSLLILCDLLEAKAIIRLFVEQIIYEKIVCEFWCHLCLHPQWAPRAEVLHQVD